MEIPEALLYPVAEAWVITVWGRPQPLDPNDFKQARILIETLDAKGITLIPKVLSKDLTDSEEGA